MKFVATIVDVAPKRKRDGTMSEKCAIVRVAVRDKTYGLICFNQNTICEMKKLKGKEVALDVYPTIEGSYGGELRESKLAINDLWKPSDDQPKFSKSKPAYNDKPQLPENDSDLPF